ncbi:MAG: DUF1289 domain-containing protein [Kiloniellales bacterium]|nr:DUF1289 domain-containing protein [Kiloniellales bacterium]
MALASPCVGICKLDDTTGWCLGCARSGDEIAGWRGQTDPWRAAVWEALPERLRALGVTCRRLPWKTEEIRTFATRSLRSATGTWVIGVVGALAEFSTTPGDRVGVETDGGRIEASNSGGNLRFLIDERVRALTFDPPDTPVDRQRVVLAVKRERGRLTAAAALADLGPDSAAIRREDREQRLYDLGLGREEARFCVRCGTGAAQDALAGATGDALAAAMPSLAPILLRDSPARVVESALGRIEVLTPIPEPGGRSPAGPHTHLLPDHLATERALPVGMELPSAYLPGAIFYPAA